MATPRKFNGPATEGDWANYRDTITRMYIDQNKSLKEVMRVMKEQYYFFATEKMYKIRFKKWGVHKNLRPEQVGKLLIQQDRRAAAGKPSVAFVHGRKIDRDRLHAYLQRVSPARRKELESILAGRQQEEEEEESGADAIKWDIACRTPSPEPEPTTTILPPHLDAPDDLRLPEECMHIVHSYVDGAVDASIWRVTPERELVLPARARTWLDPVSCARQLLLTGFTKEGFQMLRISFDHYRDVMHRQDPSLLIETCLGLGALLQTGPGLPEALINYACEMSRIVLGPRHPLNLLLSRMKCVGPGGVAPYAAIVMQSYIAAMQRGSWVNPTYLATIYRAMVTSEFMDKEAAHRFVQGLVRELEADTTRDRSAEIQQMRTLITWMFHLHKQPAEVRMAAQNMSKNRKADPRIARFSCYSMLFSLTTNHHYEDDEAIQLMYDSLDICEGEYGRGDSSAATVRATLEGYLRRAGRLKEAAKVRRDFEVRWDDVCEQMSRLRT
ncbi:Clr5 domain-containing protein [Xylariaceae sp. FL0662B]|nr:Clr5 domain-containing protein [Xylariaceae sp. FL0662B]